MRNDVGVETGSSVSIDYDPMLGKLIVRGNRRAEALMRLSRAADEFVIDGIETTLPLYRTLVREKAIIDGDYHINWLEAFLARGGTTP